MTLTLRYMRLDDVPAVVLIDNLSFDAPWTTRSFVFELTESDYSHLVVLEGNSGGQATHPVVNSAAQQAANGHRAPAENGEAKGWRKWLRKLGQASRSGTDSAEVLAYGGLWLIADEAHISTIATHPVYRQRGYGELVLAAMIRKSIAMRASYIVLEVRVSNTAAQALYQKYGFVVFDRKPNYYHNNSEDAYDMRLSLLDNPDYADAFPARYDALIQSRAAHDAFTAATRPVQKEGG